MDVDHYLARIGFEGAVTLDLDTLEGLMRAHLTTVPFENLDVFRGVEVHTGVDWSVPKVVGRGRGGWCFELNGAFAALLEALGFTVARLGAAVLLGGPATVVDHLALEVILDRPYLVDVGFGDSFCRPLILNHRGLQDGGTDDFELMAAPRAPPWSATETARPNPSTGSSGSVSTWPTSRPPPAGWPPLPASTGTGGLSPPATSTGDQTGWP